MNKVHLYDRRFDLGHYRQERSQDSEALRGAREVDTEIVDGPEPGFFPVVRVEPFLHPRCADQEGFRLLINDIERLDQPVELVPFHARRIYTLDI